MNITMKKIEHIGWIQFTENPYLSINNLKELYRLINELENDLDVDVIAFTSETDSFCNGFNIEELVNFNEAEAKIFSFLGQRLTKRMRNLKKIIVSMVHGNVLGAGFEIVLASDIIFSTKTSFFGFPETNFGIIPGFGGTQLMSRKIYETFTKYLVFTGEKVDATELFDKGIITKLFNDKKEMIDYFHEFTKKLRKRSIFAIGLAKEVINNGIEIDIEKALLLEQNAFTVAFASNDKKEGMSAFIEKRKPIFTDRWENLKKL